LTTEQIDEEHRTLMHETIVDDDDDDRMPKCFVNYLSERLHLTLALRTYSILRRSFCRCYSEIHEHESRPPSYSTTPTCSESLVFGMMDNRPTIRKVAEESN